MFPPRHIIPPAIVAPRPSRPFGYVFDSSESDEHISVLPPPSPDDQHPYSELGYEDGPAQPIDTERLYIEDTSNLKTPPFDSFLHTVPGVYEIRNLCLKKRVEVDFNQDDGKHVVRLRSFRGYDELQTESRWEFVRWGNGWAIKSVSGELYLTIDRRESIGTRVSVAANGFPVAWRLRDDGDNVRISWQNPEYLWNPDSENDGATTVVLDGDCGDWTVWRLERMPGSLSTPSLGTLSRISQDYPSPGDDTKCSYTIAKKTTRTKRIPRTDRCVQRNHSNSDGDTDCSFEVSKTVTRTKEFDWSDECSSPDVSSSDDDSDDSFMVTETTAITKVPS